MALLNQFQQYSQGENTITNNVLLMLSNLYEISPKYYEDYIRGLTEDAQYEILPSFTQQIGNRGDGIIDGHIQVKASKIIIETKISALEWIDKLVKYAKSFDENEHKILFHLSSATYSAAAIAEIKYKLSENRTIGQVNFHSITYQEMVAQLNALAAKFIYEPSLQRLNEHFEAYCIGMNLIPRSNYMLRAMACGQSFDLNIKHQFYFDLAHRGYTEFNYLGIYYWKSVRYIGKVENVIEADWDELNGLSIIDSKFNVTPEQHARLTEAIVDSVKSGWDISKNHKFFLLSEFHETNFVKTSPGGIFRVRYFDLKDHFAEIPENFVDVAEQLKKSSWN